MTKVGNNKRLSYYQRTGDEVIADLRSHPYGLTLPESKRRLEQNGANLIYASGNRIRPLRAISQPWFVFLALLAASGAWYLSNQTLFVGLLIIVLLAVVADLWREFSRDNLQYHLHQLLPAKTTVRRNDLAQVIDASELVVGDIVELEIGARVPADMRILTSDELLVNDAVLFGGGHEHKFTHAVPGDLPLIQQHNMAFAGTAVVSGSGRAIVTATGMQTELGRILAQADATTPKSSLFHSIFGQLTRQFSWVAAGLLIVLGIVAAVANLDTQTTTGYGLAVVVSLLPVSIIFAAVRMFAVFAGRSRQTKLHVQAASAADRLGSINTLLLDESEFIIESTPVAAEFLIGKKRYRSAATELSPNDKLVDDTGKTLSKKAISERQLFFDALVLSSHSRLLPPDGDAPSWHVAGPANDGALIALAMQAGLTVDATRQRYPLVGHNTFDHQRGMASTVCQYDHRQLVFVHGAGQHVIERAARIWDAGHTRKLSAADRTRLSDYHDQQAKGGNIVLAIAYRQLSSKQSGDMSHQELEKDLVLLGLVSIGQPVKHSAVLALTTARNQDVTASLISNRPSHVALTTARQLGFIKPTVLTSSDLAQLSDSQLHDRVINGNNVFLHLTPEDRLRLVTAASRGKHRVAMSGSSLSDIPALRQANIALCLPTHSRAISEEADVVLTANDLNALLRAYGRSREISAHLRRLMHSALSDHSLQLWLVVISFTLYLTNYIPLATTATLLLAASLLHSLAFAAVGDDTTGRRESPVPLAPHPTIVTIVLGLLGAALLCANFVFFFMRQGLGAGHIDSSSNLYLQAATLSFVTLTLLMWVNLLFARAQHTTDLLSHQLRNTTLLRVFGLYLLIVVALVYNKPLQDILGTRSLSTVDVLWAVITAQIYFLIRLVAHTERQRSRGAIIALHHQVHGRHAGPKV